MRVSNMIRNRAPLARARATERFDSQRLAHFPPNPVTTTVHCSIPRAYGGTGVFSEQGYGIYRDRTLDDMRASQTVVAPQTGIPPSLLLAMSKTASTHRWSFYRAGGVDQVRLEKGADIFNLDQLDKKLWIALSCPTKGLEIDERMLELIDSDSDGHVRPPEILATVEWLREVLQSADGIANGIDGVALANIRKDTDEGKAVFASAKHALKSLKTESVVITVDDIIEVTKIFAKAKLNGDGIVPAETIEDEAVRAVATEVITCMGGTTDRSGEIGYDKKQLDDFFTACTDFAAWHKAADDDAKNVLPFGKDTGAAYDAFTAVRTKIDDYFGRCRLAAYDARALAAVNREQEAYIAAAASDLTITADEMAHFPLSMVEAGKPLNLIEALNPAWAVRIDAFRSTCTKKKDSLNEKEWADICARFAGYASWLGTQAGDAVASLGIDRVKKILAGKGKDGLQKAIDDDLVVATEFESLVKVEKLTRLHKSFGTLLTNYVSFADFYARKGAIFQAGTLYLDGRTCEMCFNVNDAAKHAKMAPMSNALLAYMKCTRKSGETMEVACAFTDGDDDNLFVGRNGIFYDRAGLDWDATISKIVSNPISIRQAFWAPYKKVLRMIQDMISKRAADADAAAAKNLAAGASSAGAAAAKGATPAKPKVDIGSVAAIGIVVTGALGVFTSLLVAFLGLGPWIPIGIIGILLAISGPSMFIAFLKLRTRNLGPILDANGWAVNALTRVNIPLGKSMTAMPKIPADANRTLKDPYAPKKSIWPRVILVLLLLAGTGYVLYRTNLLNKWLPDYVPAHHAETALVAVGKPTGVPGDAIAFKVSSDCKTLLVYNVTDARTQLGHVEVVDGKATWTIPADSLPGTFEVKDDTDGSAVTVTVTAAPAKK